MYSTRPHYLWLLACFLGTPAAAQIVTGDFGVVTTDGVFQFDAASGGPATLVAPASLFGGLVHPSIEWNSVTNTFVVASGNKIFVVDASGGGATVTDLQPGIPSSARIRDIDINPATGELFALDADAGTVWRFWQPFVVGMVPVGSIGPVAAGSTAMCVDSRGYPLAVIVAEPTRIRRHELDGSASIVLTFPGSGLDMNPVFEDGLRHTFFCRGPTSSIGRSLAGNPSVYIDLQTTCFAGSEYSVKNPQDIEWDASRSEWFSLAQSGMDPCFPGHIGVQIARHYWVVVSPGVLGKAIQPMTQQLSGITGQDGDLTAVGGIFALVHPYGEGCPTGAGEPLADASPPFIGQTNHVDLANAPVGAQAYLGVGSLPTRTPAFGCTILTSGDWGMLGPVTVDGNGEASVSYTLPNDPALVGAQIYVQWSILQGSSNPIFSHGLQLRAGLY